MIDTDFSRLAHNLKQIPDLHTRLGETLRRAVDKKVASVAKARKQLFISHYDLPSITRREFGFAVEQDLKEELRFPAGKRLDCKWKDVEFDIKFSIGANDKYRHAGSSWMIPKECVGELCLLIHESEHHSYFNVGVFRAIDHLLGDPAGNTDDKRGITAAGRATVHWLFDDFEVEFTSQTTLRGGQLPGNILYQLKNSDKEVFDSIFVDLAGPHLGQRRVNQLFRSQLGKVVNGHVIEIVASQKDPGKRVRDARKVLHPEGIRILGGKYDQKELAKLGFGKVPNDSYVSVRVQ
jgi:hypothetical protein